MIRAVAPGGFATGVLQTISLQMISEIVSEAEYPAFGQATETLLLAVGETPLLPCIDTACHIVGSDVIVP